MTESVETFAPRVLVCGRDYTPKGYEWILAFALRGCQWAIDAASEPSFRESIIASLVAEKEERIREMIDSKLDEIEDLRKRLRTIRDQMANAEKSQKG